jgi:hypothetical protein
MSKTLLLYCASFVFVIVGVLLIRTGLKKESLKSLMMKINYVPTRNYGKFFYVALGILCFIIGIALLVSKSK